MEHAQSLDTADRYLNNKYIRFLLRANQLSKVESVAAKFVKVVFIYKSYLLLYSAYDSHLYSCKSLVLKTLAGDAREHSDGHAA